MATSVTKMCPFGRLYSGLAGTIGYTVFRPDGSTYSARTTSGIKEPISGSGAYVAAIGVPNGTGVIIVWDNGSTPVLYRVDDSNPRYGNSPPTTFVLAKAVTFGPGYSGLAGQVGLALKNGNGSTYAARTTSGIVELVSGSGIYGAAVTVPTASGVGLLWDSGGSTPIYAQDKANPYYPLVTATTVQQQLTLLGCGA